MKDLHRVKVNLPVYWCTRKAPVAFMDQIHGSEFLHKNPAHMTPQIVSGEFSPHTSFHFPVPVEESKVKICIFEEMSNFLLFS